MAFFSLCAMCVRCTVRAGWVCVSVSVCPPHMNAVNVSDLFYFIKHTIAIINGCLCADDANNKYFTFTTMCFWICVIYYPNAFFALFSATFFFLNFLLFGFCNSHCSKLLCSKTEIKEKNEIFFGIVFNFHLV